MSIVTDLLSVFLAGEEDGLLVAVVFVLRVLQLRLQCVQLEHVVQSVYLMATVHLLCQLLHSFHLTNQVTSTLTN